MGVLITEGFLDLEVISYTTVRTALRQDDGVLVEKISSTQRFVQVIEGPCTVYVPRGMKP